MGRPVLDACLIVRDEEANLPDCLASLQRLRPLLGRICVYDTGSVDKTVAVARAAGADVHQGYWDDDFARARNASLAMSRAEWALLVDADERVVADAARLGRALTSATSIDVLNASFSHLDDHGRVIGRSDYEKVARVGRIEFFGRVHETVRRLDGKPVRLAALADDILHFRHLGYATAEIRAAKAERNAAVSHADVTAALASGDLWWIGQSHYHHARSLQRLGAVEQALDALDAAQAAFPAGTIARDRVVVAQVGLLLEAAREKDATAVTAAHLAAGGAAHLARLLLARIALHADRPADALAALERIPDGGDPEHEVDPREVLRLQMAALDRLGRADEALACCVILVSRWGDLAQVVDLLHRLQGHEAEVVAALLADDAPPSPALLDELRRDGDFGREIAARMVRSG